MRAVIVFLSFLALMPANAAVHKAKQPFYVIEVEAAKIIKKKCPKCSDTKIRDAILKTESKGPYARADELARDALKAARQ